MMRTEDGFTLIETLLAMALMLIAASVLVMGSGVAVHGVSQSIRAVGTAVTCNRIDRHIRACANAVHIPYWSNAQPYVAALTAELYRSKFGAYITSVRTIGKYPQAPRGIEVAYTVNHTGMRTAALFSSVAVMEERP